MTAMVRVALLSALAAASIPASAAAQDTSAAALVRRIESLERRVSTLESLIKIAPPQIPPIPVSTRWQDLANWRQLQLGMRMDAVRALLGEPKRVDAGPVTFWRWGAANVSFMNGKVEGWSEPGR